MNGSVFYSVVLIAVAVLCTQATRWAPFLAFGGKRQVPGAVRYLGSVLPAAIMAALVVYCLKGLRLTSFPFGAPELISVAVVTALHLWKKNTLLSIGGGTLCYMVLIRTLFRV